MSHYSASFSTTVRVHLDDRPGAFADLARAIADAGGLLDAIDLVRVEAGRKVRDVSVLATDPSQADAIVRAVSIAEPLGGLPSARSLGTAPTRVK